METWTGDHLVSPERYSSVLGSFQENEKVLAPERKRKDAYAHIITARALLYVQSLASMPRHISSAGPKNRTGVGTYDVCTLV